MKHDTDSLRFRPEGLAVTGTLLALGQLAAQTPAPAEKKKDEGSQKPEELSEIVVDADKEKQLYKPERLASPKFTQPIRDIAQTVTVVPKEVIQQQGATSLRDVLRNVPGISMQAGEGGVPAGDNLSIRGFSARTDLFIDGVRDFGGYTRDPFNLEQVEVTKGPSSTNAGRGSTGGSINLASKTPKLDKAYEIMLGGGTDDYMRGTFDINQPIEGLKGAAFRVNGMYHNADTPGRDIATEERWGLAPSIAFGLGTETRATLSFFHLDQKGIPDYGIPWVPAANTAFPNWGDHIAPVDYSNFYGLVLRDHFENTTDLISAEIQHDFSDQAKLRNITRYGVTTTDLSVTAPRFLNNTDTTIRRTDWKTRDQVDTILANYTDLNLEFRTGQIEHKLVTGMELSLESSKNYGRTDLNAASAPTTDVFAPNPYDSYLPIIFRNGAGAVTEAFSGALYAFDTVKFNEHWQVDGGVRWDYFDVDYESRALTGAWTVLDRKDDMFSYRGAITWKPCEAGSVYLGYGTSFNPSAEGLTLGNTATAANSINVAPEESETIELGTKWEVFEEKLLLTAAIFRTDKTNARTEDPTDPGDVVVLAGEQRVQGIELGFAGGITDTWHITGGYTYLDSEIRESQNALEVGKELSNTPQNSFSLWSVNDLPGGFQVGIGANFVDSRFSSNTNVREADSYWLYNAMLGYVINEHASVQLNLNNLADKEYLDRIGGGHAIPGAGRSVTLSTRLVF
jgi:catecholate siderophore receptor